MEWAFLGDGQLEWIKAQLSDAKSKKQLVCMFGHIPLTKNIHSSKCILWDSEKLQHLLKENGQHTAAYIAGKKNLLDIFSEFSILVSFFRLRVQPHKAVISSICDKCSDRFMNSITAKP